MSKRPSFLSCLLPSHPFPLTKALNLSTSLFTSLGTWIPLQFRPGSADQGFQRSPGPLWCKGHWRGLHQTAARLAQDTLGCFKYQRSPGRARCPPRKAWHPSAPLQPRSLRVTSEPGAWPRASGAVCAAGKTENRKGADGGPLSSRTSSPAMLTGVTFRGQPPNSLRPLGVLARPIPSSFNLPLSKTRITRLSLHLKLPAPLILS